MLIGMEIKKRKTKRKIGEGLDGFRFEWVNPPICEWLSCLE